MQSLSRFPLLRHGSILIADENIPVNDVASALSFHETTTNFAVAGQGLRWRDEVQIHRRQMTLRRMVFSEVDHESRAKNLVVT